MVEVGSKNEGIMKRRRDVAIGIVIHDNNGGGGGKILICQRRSDAPLGGLWEFPGGKVEPGESPAECVVREVREETGAVVRPLRALPAIEHDYPDVHVCLHPYVCALVEGDARPIECGQVRWIDPPALRQYPFPSANAELVEFLIAQFPSPASQRG